MGAQLRVYKQKINTAQTTKKITKAMELIAASRIQKALVRVKASNPYARALTRAVSAVATYSNEAHPLTVERDELKRAAIVVLTSDRGLAGAFNSQIIREVGELRAKLESEGKEVDHYLIGNKAVGYFKFRQRPYIKEWTGISDVPTPEVAQEIAEAVLEAFAMFASDLDAASRRQLARGARLTELLKQPQYSPYPVEEQVVSIWAGTNGKLDEVAIEDVLRFERELLDYLGRNTEVLTTLRDTNVLDDDTVAKLESAVDDFKKEFQTGEGKPLASVGKEEFAPAEQEDINQEKIVKQRR